MKKNKGTFLNNISKCRNGIYALLLPLMVAIAVMGCTNNNQEKSMAVRSAGTAPAYTPYQQIFCLNMLSNISSMYNFQTADSIQDSTFYAVNAVLGYDSVQQLIGHWKRVWGPVVLSNDEDAKLHQVAANTMFVAQNLDSPSVYVIAIAGTNPESISDWLSEDLDATHVKYWHDVLADINDTKASAGTNFVTDSPFISMATYHGIHKLHMMRDKNSSDSASLVEFLRKRAKDTSVKAMNIWVTGHSLGGALSPTLALFLKDTKDTGWAAGTKAAITINCLAVAGATPGNLAFSNYYNTDNLGGGILGNNTIRVWNSHDVVPHGFDTVMLREVDTIYAGDMVPGKKGNEPLYTPDDIVLKIKKLIEKLDNRTLIEKAERKPGNPYNYTQLYPAYDTVFTSAYYTSANAYDTAKADAPNKFLGQLGCEHIPSYPHYFGVDAFQYYTSQEMHFKYPFFSFGFRPAAITTVTVTPRPSAAVTSK